MLKKIPPVLSPELLKALDEMGHTETVMLGDGNCGIANFGVPFIRLDGVGIPELLEAILQFFPLDVDCGQPVAVADWGGPRPEIWDTYIDIVNKSEEASKFKKGLAVLSEEEFFGKEVRHAALLVGTTEKALAGNILLRKGVVVNKWKRTYKIIQFIPLSRQYNPKYFTFCNNMAKACDNRGYTLNWIKLSY
jgi:L-fucose mutarotase